MSIEAISAKMSGATPAVSQSCAECGADDPGLALYCVSCIGKMQPAVPVQGEQQVDLNAAMWVSVQKAASESRWIPSEYYQNEWVADVCAFLRDGHPRQLVPVPTETLYAMLEAITTAMDNKSVPGAWLVIANNAGCEFIDSLTRTQSPEAFTPNRPCKSPDLCRKSGFCDDAWHCSTQRQEAGHD